MLTRKLPYGIEQSSLGMMRSFPQIASVSLSGEQAIANKCVANSASPAVNSGCIFKSKSNCLTLSWKQCDSAVSYVADRSWRKCSVRLNYAGTCMGRVLTFQIWLLCVSPVGRLAHEKKPLGDITAVKKAEMENRLWRCYVTIVSLPRIFGTSVLLCGISYYVCV